MSSHQSTLAFDSLTPEHPMSDATPLINTFQVANETTVTYTTETIKDIQFPESTMATPTFEEPTAIRYTNVTVHETKDRKLNLEPKPKTYINMKCLRNDGSVDISSLFYCKKCHIDLKQSDSPECPLSSNLCKECCLSSNQKCLVCSKVRYKVPTSFDVR